MWDDMRTKNSGGSEVISLWYSRSLFVYSSENRWPQRWLISRQGTTSDRACGRWVHDSVSYIMKNVMNNTSSGITARIRAASRRLSSCPSLPPQLLD